MRINIVSPDKTWIFDKIAKSIAAHGNVTIGKEPDAEADVNWYFNWYYWHKLDRPRTKYDMLFFTHINEGQGLLATYLINEADHTTTMSKWERERLIEHGALPDKMTTILPACDSDWRPRPLRIGITCRYYGDGRRREWDIIEMARRKALDYVQLHVIGAGWEPVIKELEGYGVDGICYPGTGDYEADYQINHDIVPTLDYLWHPGRDTTLGVLDALACGVPIICPPTSFAVEFAVAPGSAYWYQNAEQLEEILRHVRHKYDLANADRWMIGERAHRRTWGTYVDELMALLGGKLETDSVPSGNA